jgi:helicase MOV-10
MLFPESTDGYYQKTLNRAIISLHLYDDLLNYEQLKVVNTVLTESYGPSRGFPEVPGNVLPYCHVDDGMFSLPAFKDIMSRRIVVTTCRDADVLIQARLSNSDLFRLEQALYSSIHPEQKVQNPALHWTGLLIDEAAQATEPEALIPLTVVAPPNGHSDEQQWPIFVMAGDQHQLGPRTASKSDSMQTSLFERLLNRPFYRDHPLARSKQSGGVMRPLTQEMLPILRPAFANLIRNYRSHPAILATPSSLFYNDTLEPEATSIDSLLSWPGWRRDGWPVLFTNNSFQDEIEQDGGGWYNILEAKMACQYAKSFLDNGLVQPHEICIMSPFQAQVKVVRRFAREASMSGVNIGPLEAFQGLESRLVIICTTRTRDRFIDQDLARGLGVIHEPRRFNVALTRAKEGLIVIGNQDVLRQDENWAAFLAFCARNGLVEGFSIKENVARNQDDVVISRLEKQILHRADNQDAAEGAGSLLNGVRRLGFAEDADHALWKSGVAVETALSKHRNGEVEPSDTSRTLFE